MTSLHLLAVGGAHIDRRGQVLGDYAPAASNPGRIAEDPGGGAFNAARTAVRRGVSASLMSLRGGDADGERVAAAIRAAGIADLSVCFLDRATPSYTALIDRDGELIAALADMGLYDMGFAKQLARRAFRDAASAADALLVDANLPEAALARAVRAAGEKPVFAIGVSPAKVTRLAASLPSLACLFMNRREAARLGGVAETADLAGALGLARGVITAGAAPVVAFDGDLAFAVQPPVPRSVADVTGAGDALAGAAIAALMRGLAFEAAVREGVAAATLAVEAEAAAPAFDIRAFAEALGRVPAPVAIVAPKPPLAPTGADR